MSVHKRTTATGQVRWDVRLYRPDGREYSRTFRTRGEADRFQATERADRARGTWIDPSAGEVLFKAWAREWYDSTLHTWRPRTAEAHETALRVHWLPRFGHMEIGSIRPRQVQAAINELAKTYRPTTVRTYYATLRSVFADAVEVDLIGRTPCRVVKLPSLRADEKRTISPAELHHLADTVGPRWRCLIYLGGVMGLRFGEAAALRVRDVDLAQGRLSVTRTVTEMNGRLQIGLPKTGAGTRTLVMPGPLVEELRPLVDAVLAARGADGLLFSDRHGGPIRRSNFARRVFIPSIEAAGLDGLTFHGLRHSAATLWVADGVDARTVQHRLGHADPRLVLRLYAHTSTVADERAAEVASRTYWS